MTSPNQEWTYPILLPSDSNKGLCLHPLLVLTSRIFSLCSIFLWKIQTVIDRVTLTTDCLLPSARLLYVGLSCLMSFLGREKKNIYIFLTLVKVQYEKKAMGSPIFTINHPHKFIFPKEVNDTYGRIARTYIHNNNI